MNYVSLRHYDKVHVEKGLRNFHSSRAYIAIKTLKKALNHGKETFKKKRFEY